MQNKTIEIEVRKLVKGETKEYVQILSFLCEVDFKVISQVGLIADLLNTIYTKYQKKRENCIGTVSMKYKSQNSMFSEWEYHWGKNPYELYAENLWHITNVYSAV